MDSGKTLRWRRFVAPGASHCLIVPIDHGLTLGPLDGIQSVADMSRWIGHPAITGVVVHKGIAQRLGERGVLAHGGVMVHLNGMSSLAPDPDHKELLTGVETAMRLGADAVSLQVNFDGSADAHNLSMLGSVVDSASGYGLPVLTMLYDKVGDPNPTAARARLRHWMRSAVELGTDAIKIGPPERPEEMAALIDGLADDVKILVAGGDMVDDETIAAMAQAARAAGAAGMCVGRNVFGRPDPGPFLDRLDAVLRDTELRSAA